MKKAVGGGHAIKLARKKKDDVGATTYVTKIRVVRGASPARYYAPAVYKGRPLLRVSIERDFPGDLSAAQWGWYFLAPDGTTHDWHGWFW